MAKFLTTNGTSSRIEDIIINAKEKLVLVSPFLQLSKIFFERLKDATKRNVETTIIYGKDELKPNEKNSLAELKNVRLFYLENLHAKCYFNEKEMVITSMNMYEFSEKNNREMGVYIEANNDRQLFEAAVTETDSIIEHSEIISLKKVERVYYQKEKDHYNSRENNNKRKPPKVGYCLRCETRIGYNPEKPFCYDCFTIWAQYGNVNFNENVCHCCGEFTNPVSMGKPLCYSCNEKYSMSA